MYANNSHVSTGLYRRDLLAVRIGEYGSLFLALQASPQLRSCAVRQQINAQLGGLEQGLFRVREKEIAERTGECLPGARKRGASGMGIGREREWE
jgi:hypothetical protein